MLSNHSFSGVSSWRSISCETMLKALDRSRSHQDGPLSSLFVILPLQSWLIWRSVVIFEWPGRTGSNAMLMFFIISSNAQAGVVIRDSPRVWQQEKEVKQDDMIHLNLLVYRPSAFLKCCSHLCYNEDEWWFVSFQRVDFTKRLPLAWARTCGIRCELLVHPFRTHFVIGSRLPFEFYWCGVEEFLKVVVIFP